MQQCTVSAMASGPSRPLPTLTSKEILQIEQIIRRLEQGSVLTKLYPKRKPEKRSFCVKRESRQLVWDVPIAGKKFEGVVDFREIKEVRIGRCSKIFERWQDDAKKWEAGRCFVILYGSTFRLKTVSCVGMYLVYYFEKW